MRKSTKRLAIGSIIAAATGFAAGILTAPKSGKETREDIKDGVLKARSEAEKKLKKLHTELDSHITAATEKAKKLTNSAQVELVEATTKAKQAKDKVKQILTAIHDGVADDKDLEKAVSEASKAVEHLKKFIGK